VVAFNSHFKLVLCYPRSYGTEENILKCFRRVRDEIKDWLSKTFGKKDEM